MYKVIALALLSSTLSLAVNASSYIWSSAIPTQVHILPDGLLLKGDFENEGVSCAGDLGAAAIYLPKTDDNFDSKLSLALTAFAAGKQIQTLIYTSADSDCIQISASGYVPKAHTYYWQLLN